MNEEKVLHRFVEAENLLLLPAKELPITDPENAKKKIKKESKHNCLQDMILELMTERGLKDADMVKALNMPWATWSDWIHKKNSTQLTGDDLYNLMMFFNVHLEYLVYGIGNGEPAFEKFDEMRMAE